MKDETTVTQVPAGLFPFLKPTFFFFFVWFFFFFYDLLAFQGRVVCFSCVMLILVNHVELLYLDFSTKSSENTPPAV